MCRFQNGFFPILGFVNELLNDLLRYYNIMTQKYKKALCVTNFPLLLRYFILEITLDIFFQIINYNIKTDVYILQVSDKKLSFCFYI